MSERTAAHAAQIQPGKGRGPARPTQKEVDEGVPGTAAIPPEKLPPGVVPRGEKREG